MSKDIKISEIITDLETGLTRDAIGLKYSITTTEVKFLFQHPKLKNKKTKKVFKPSFNIVDDVEVPEVENIIAEEEVTAPIASQMPDNNTTDIESDFS